MKGQAHAASPGAVAMLAGGTRAPVADLLGLIEPRVDVRARHVAVESSHGVLSYAELWRHSGLLADRLQSAGVPPGSAVGLSVPRGRSYVTSVLAILRAGAVVVALDPAYPVARTRYMSSVAGVALVLSADLDGEDDLDAVRLVSDAGGVGDRAARGPGDGRGSRPGDAYVVFTSGSTGRPKGVAITRAAISNLAAWQASEPGWSPTARVAFCAPTSFDVSFQEIFSALVAGGTVVAASEDVRRNPAAFLRWLSDTMISHWFTPYVALQMVSLEAAATRGLADLGLREIITAGEQLKCTPEVRAFVSRLPSCGLTNQYGPVESHVVTHHRLAADTTTWPNLPPIGVPVPNVEVSIRDEAGTVLPKGEVGEICIAGLPVAAGYIGQDHAEESARRFIMHASALGGRYYRTGDQGLVTEDGLQFVGRVDDQVKINGYRVELAEVESILCQHVAVNDAACFVYGDDSIDRRLGAAVMTDAGHLPAVRQYLASTLPPHLIPRPILALPDIPVTPSGKADRRRLAALARSSIGGSGHVRDPDGTLATVVSAFAGVLGPGLAADSSPWDLGMRSLDAAVIAGQLSQVLGARISVSEILLARSPRRVAESLERRGAGEGVTDPARLPRLDEGPVLPSQRDYLVGTLGLFGADQVPVAGVVLRIRGDFDAGRFHAALGRLAERHDSLKTRYARSSGVYRQQVVRAAEPTLVRLPNGTTESEVVQAAVGACRSASDPTVPSAALTRVDGGQHLVVVAANHVAWDAISIGIALNELGGLYQRPEEGWLSAPTPQPIQLASATSPDPDGATPDLDDVEFLNDGFERLLSKAEPHANGPGTGLVRIRVALPATIYRRVVALTGRLHTTEFCVLATAFGLAACSVGDSSISWVSTPWNGRNVVGSARTVAYLMRGILIPVVCPGAASILDVLGSVTDAMNRAVDGAGPWTARLLRRRRAAGYRRPQPSAAMLVVQPALVRHMTFGPAGARVTTDLGFPDVTGFPIVLNLAVDAESLRGWLDVDTSSLSIARAQELLGAFRRSLDSLVTDAS